MHTERAALNIVIIAGPVSRAARAARAAGSWVLGFCLLAGVSAPLSAQEPFAVPRLTGPIVLDGRSDEPAWEAIPPLPAVGHSPTFGAEPSERTEFRLAYDEMYLYASGRLFDAHPGGVRSTSLRRDESSTSNDWFSINLDTFLDRETTLTFGTTPTGLRSDLAWSNDGTTPNFTWNTFWDAAVAVDESGWHAEIRIPLSSLRFEVRNGGIIIGATLWRNIARNNEIVTWPAIRNDWGGFSVFKASQMRDVALAGVQRRNPVYVTPYVLGGLSRRNVLSPARDAYGREDTLQRDPGVDIKFSPTSNFTVDLTANTDFAQVEADDQQVNLTRFSLFFPERRLFFQERGSVFDYSLGGNESLFYSRRIGLVDGAPVRIYGGARAVGRLGGWDIGMLDMQTAASDTTGSENSAVVRARRRVLNENSYVGALVTSRLGGGTDNLAYGADALLRLFGQDFLSLNLAQSLSDGGPGTDRDGGSFARVQWERRGLYGATYGLEAARVGADFNPALGFVSRRDYVRLGGRLGRGVRGAPGSRVLRQSFSASGTAYRHLRRQLVESAEFGPEWSLESRSGRAFTVAAMTRHEDLERAFRIATNAVVPPGAYQFTEVTGRYAAPGGSPLRINGAVTGGTFYDGSRVSLSVTPTWNTSAHLQLSGTYQWNRIDFAARGQEFLAQVARLRALVMFDSRTSATSFIQYNSATDTVVVNFRLRYNPREGTDLYVVYNHGLNTDQFAYSPTRPLTDSGTLLVKFSRTLTLAR